VSLTKKEKEFLEKHPKIILGGDKSWYPYLNKRKDGTLEGIDVDIIKKVNTLTGANFQIKATKWNEVLKEAKEKKIDGLVTSAKHDERREYFNFSKGYSKNYKRLLVKHGNPQNIKSVEDLKNKTIVIQNGNLFIEKLAKKISNIKIIYKDTLEDVYQEVIYGVADATIHEAPIEHLTNELGIPHLNVAFNFDEKLELVFSIRKDWIEAISILNKGLESISKSEIEQIHEKWVKKFQFNSNQTKKLIYTDDELKYLSSKMILKVCADPTWYSFSHSKVDSSEAESLSIHFLDIVLSKIGIKRELVYTKTWKESLQFIKEKKCDMITSIQKNEQRDKYINFTSPFAYQSATIVTHNEIPYIFNLDTLINKKIAMLGEHAAIELFKEKYPFSDIVLIDSGEEGIEKVKSKEVFGYIELIPVLLPLLDNEEDVKINRQLDFGLSLSMGIRDDELLLHSIIEKTLNSIPEIERNKIFNKLIDNKYKKKTDYSLIIELLLVFLFVIAFVLYWNFQLKKSIKSALIKNKKQESLLTYYSNQDAMKDLVGNISHQWRQPIDELSSVLLYIETKLMLKQEITQDDIIQSVEKSRNIINYLNQTVKIFSNFYTKNENKNNIRINTLIDEALFIIKGSYEKNKIQVVVDIQDVTLQIKGDELQQVILAILSNIQNIVIERNIKKPVVHISFYKKEANIILKIKDNCGGIKKDIDKIFDLGVSNLNSGRGLGLYISKRIVEDKYGGIISANNSAKGATFKIVLPPNYTDGNGYELIKELKVNDK
jgi:polar amino acid transport system substrate-binding protein